MIIPKKKIWIVNFHTAPPGYALNLRYIKMVPYLQKAGYEVTIISSSYLRRHNKKLSDNRYTSKTYDGIPFVHINSIKYSGNGFKRMFSIFQFAIRLIFIDNRFDRPDIIYHNLHVPFDIPVFFAAKRFKAKYIAEVWDLWPEFFHRMGLVKKANLLLKLVYQSEKWIYNKAKAIVFTMEGGKDYIVDKKWNRENGGPIDLNKIFYINNGIDLKQFEVDELNYKIVDVDLENENTFKVVYIGSMHLSNNIEQLIDAAKVLKNHPEVKILLYGSGSERKKLIKYCADNEIDNVIFKQEYLPFNQLPYVLSKSSLNILNYQKDFGDFGISAGKLFLYLASGKPMISNVKVNYCVIAKNNLGISKDLQDSSDYAEAILEIQNLPKADYNLMCNRVKNAAKEFDYQLLAKNLIGVLKTVETTSRYEINN